MYSSYSERKQYVVVFDLHEKVAFGSESRNTSTQILSLQGQWVQLKTHLFKGEEITQVNFIFIFDFAEEDPNIDLRPGVHLALFISQPSDPNWNSAVVGINCWGLNFVVITKLILSVMQRYCRNLHQVHWLEAFMKHYNALINIL